MSTKRSRLINPGGINGTGKGVVNINSKDYKGLQKAILEHSKNQNPKERIKYELISLKLQLESYISESEPDQLISAGEFLKKHLTALKVRNKQLANYLEIEESNLSAILKGRRKINPDLAFKLGQLFKIEPNYWLLIQSKNELLQIDKKRKAIYKKYRLEDLLKKGN